MILSKGVPNEMVIIFCFTTNLREVHVIIKTITRCRGERGPL